jgi:hypothetical protein
VPTEDWYFNAVTWILLADAMDAILANAAHDGNRVSDATAKSVRDRGAVIMV